MKGPFSGTDYRIYVYWELYKSVLGKQSSIQLELNHLTQLLVFNETFVPLLWNKKSSRVWRGPY